MRKRLRSGQTGASGVCQGCAVHAPLALVRFVQLVPAARVSSDGLTTACMTMFSKSFRNSPFEV